MKVGDQVRMARHHENSAIYVVRAVGVDGPFRGLVAWLEGIEQCYAQSDLAPVHVEFALAEYLGGLGFCLRWTLRGDTWADVEAFEIVGRYTDSGATIYNRKGYTFSPDPVDTIDEAATYLTGFVKWDGCSEFAFADENHNTHLCGARDYARLCALLRHIWTRAFELMQREQPDEWPKDVQP